MNQRQKVNFQKSLVQFDELKTKYQGLLFKAKVSGNTHSAENLRSALAALEKRRAHVAGMLGTAPPTAAPATAAPGRTLDQILRQKKSRDAVAALFNR